MNGIMPARPLAGGGFMRRSMFRFTCAVLLSVLPGLIAVGRNVLRRRGVLPEES